MKTKILKRLGETKKLDKPYNYYDTIRKKTNYLYDKYELTKYTHIEDKTLFKIPLNDEMARQLFYNYNLNLCNQIIYNYTYNFNPSEFNFFIHFHIEDILNDIIKTFVKDINKMRRIENLKPYSN